MRLNVNNWSVKNGTPAGNRHLCKSCSWGLYTTGYRESEVLVICMQANPAHTVPFIVHQCTEFEHRTHPDWDQMKELAIAIHGPRKSTPGFLGKGFAQRQHPEDEDELEEVARG
jgi:hypothetical protein